MIRSDLNFTATWLLLSGAATMSLVKSGAGVWAPCLVWPLERACYRMLVNGPAGVNAIRYSTNIAAAPTKIQIRRFICSV